MKLPNMTVAEIRAAAEAGKRQAMKRMSRAQREALEVLAAHGHGSAYSLRRPRGTLNALVARGYATKSAKHGALFSPRTSIVYVITDAGRAALKDAGAAS